MNHAANIAPRTRDRRRKCDLAFCATGASSRVGRKSGSRIADAAVEGFSPVLVVWSELGLSGCAGSVVERVEGSDAIFEEGEPRLLVV